MQARKPNLRVEFRKQEFQRVMESALLTEKYPALKSLTVQLTYFTPGSGHQSGQMKYTVNIAHARSVFRLECSNRECVCGDHDLSAVLAESIARRSKTIIGEATCQGWRSKADINHVRCLVVLRYKFVLGYR